MKKKIRSLSSLLIATVVILSFTACMGKEEPATESGTNADSQSGQTNSALWDNAVYTEDTELGQGSKTFRAEVIAEEKAVTFTIHTDKETVGDALTENNLITGDEGEYGLYVKSVNGITADYDIDKSYWSFYINGEYATSGVDTTEITEGAVYQLEYTK